MAYPVEKATLFDEMRHLDLVFLSSDNDSFGKALPYHSTPGTLPPIGNKELFKDLAAGALIYDQRVHTLFSSDMHQSVFTVCAILFKIKSG